MNSMWFCSTVRTLSARVSREKQIYGGVFSLRFSLSQTKIKTSRSWTFSGYNFPAVISLQTIWSKLDRRPPKCTLFKSFLVLCSGSVVVFGRPLGCSSCFLVAYNGHWYHFYFSTFFIEKLITLYHNSSIKNMSS